MFERFTEKAIKVIMLAQEEARRLGHNYVGTEQILLGLIGEGTGVAAKALKSHGINLKDARVRVESHIGRGKGFVAVEIPFTPRSKRLLELAWDEAHQLRHNYIGTEHLLLGLIREGEGIAAVVLRESGILLSDLRTDVVDNIQQPLSTSGQACDMFEGFTEKALEALRLAQEESRRLGHNFVGSEHLLLGLMGENCGSASKALEAYGLRLSELRKTVENRIGRGEGRVPNEIPYTTECTRKFELAREEARLLGHDFVSTEHVLLGLLRYDSGISIQVLLDSYVDLDKLKVTILNMIAASLELASPHTKTMTEKISSSTLDVLANQSIAAIVHAQDEASRMGHDVVNSGHLLLGLIAGHHDSAMKALRSRGIYLTEARAELRKLCGTRPERTVTVNRFSPRVQQILCATKSRRGNHPGTLVLPEDILTALLDETEGTAIDILKELECEVGDLRNQLLQIGQSPITGVAHPLPDHPIQIKALTDCFTESAVRIVKLAAHEAQNANSERIGTEHLVVALYIDGAARAAQSHQDRELVLDQLRSSLKCSPRGQQGSESDLPFSENLKDVFSRAFKFAQSGGSTEIDPEHLLLGLMSLSDASASRSSEDKCSGLQALGALGVELSELRSSARDLESQSERPMSSQDLASSTGTFVDAPKVATTASDFSTSNSFENFDSDTMVAILIAHEESRRQGRNLVGSEQLLLGLLLEPKGNAGKILRAIPLDLDFVRQTIEEITGASEIAEFKTVPYTFRLKTILGFAQYDVSGTTAVSTEKLLLTLLRDPYCIAVKILTLACVNIGALKRILLAEDLSLPVVQWDLSLKQSSPEEKDVGDHFPLYSLRFSSSLKAVIELAKSFATVKSRGIAGPEHLHVALCDQFFDDQEIEKDETYYSLAAALGKNAAVPSPFYVFTPTARQVVTQAFYSARYDGEAMVRPKHLIAAIRKLNK